jgi:hypothetical protein
MHCASSCREWKLPCCVFFCVGGRGGGVEGVGVVVTVVCLEGSRIEYRRPKATHRNNHHPHTRHK